MSCCRIALHVGEPENIALHIGGEVYGVETPPYEGEYTVIPGEAVQVMPTSGKRLLQDMVVEPIPQNYGRIAWDGTGIMVY